MVQNVVSYTNPSTTTKTWKYLKVKEREGERKRERERERETTTDCIPIKQIPLICLIISCLLIYYKVYTNMAD